MVAVLPTALQIQAVALSGPRSIYRTVFGPMSIYRLAKTRFSDPRTPPEFGIVYFAFDVKTCFVETILRDQLVGHVGQYDPGESGERFMRR